MVIHDSYKPKNTPHKYSEVSDVRLKMNARLIKNTSWARYSQNVTIHAQPVKNHKTDEPENTSAKNIDRAPASKMNVIFASNDTVPDTCACSSMLP